jgi:hypothetical protein
LNESLDEAAPTLLPSKLSSLRRDACGFHFMREQRSETGPSVNPSSVDDLETRLKSAVLPPYPPERIIPHSVRTGSPSKQATGPTKQG